MRKSCWFQAIAARVPAKGPPSRSETSPASFPPTMTADRGIERSALRSPLEPFLFALSPVNSGTALPHLRRERFLLFAFARSFPPFIVELFAVSLASMFVETRTHRRKCLLAIRDVSISKLPTRPTLSEPFQVLAPSTGFAPSSMAFGAHLLPCNRPSSPSRSCEGDKVCPSRPPSRKPWDRGYGLLLQERGITRSSLPCASGSSPWASHSRGTQRKAATNIADG